VKFHRTLLIATILFLIYPSYAALQQESEKLSLPKAAEQGDASAQFQLGLKYLYGNGVSQDYAHGEEDYSSGSFKIRTQEMARVEIQHDFQLSTPRFVAKEWIVHVSKAPTYEGQQRTTTSAHIQGAPAQTKFAAAYEDSVLKRPIFSARVAVVQTNQRHSIHVKTIYRTTPIHRRLVPGRSAIKIRPLSRQEQKWYTATTGVLDYKSAAMRKWIKKAGLIRKPDENELGFAYRVLVYMKKTFRWVDVKEFDPGHRASKVCQAMRGDCAKLCLVYSSVLRANRIPTRIIGVRWIPSGMGHIMTEFYTKSIGWIPVDVLVDKKGEDHYSGKGLSEGFGSTNGDYFVHYIDDGYRLKTFNGMVDILGLHSVVWYARGGGSYDDLKISEKWTVSSPVGGELLN